MRISVVFLILLLSTGVAHTQDCQAILNQLLRGGANFGGWGERTADWYNRNCGVQQLAPAPQRTMADRAAEAVARQLARFSELVQTPRWSGNFYGGQKLSDVLKKEEVSNLYNIPKAPAGFVDQYEGKPQAPIKLDAGINPFSGKFDPALLKSSSTSTLSEQNPADSRLGPPGTQGIYSNCTFDSPACKRNGR